MSPEEAKAWLGESVSRETLERLETYHTLLLKWQPTINLVAPATLGEAWQRHFVDSAQLFEHIPDGAERWLDLGSGGGFPGLVLAAMGAEANTPLTVTLVESDIRKCGFLREVGRAMGVKVNILSRRISEVPNQSADVISARALSGLDKLVDHAKPHLGANTRLLFPKGSAWREELETLPARWQTICEPIPSLTHDDAVILKFDVGQLEGDA
ncbi:16S rRNA (guanine(527)-N(7))-methyltransferase RsmG [Gymnodinialimonas hymeniacidonis]|uniref:16S rRNA (guanine(527)-N(7))-methyltransferase RsmG n=1 Tax=Gymnodinialimonas hymeniacidonis TaxID=3126508 RepID=UPI0034C5D826